MTSGPGAGKGAVLACWIAPSRMESAMSKLLHAAQLAGATALLTVCAGHAIAAPTQNKEPVAMPAATAPAPFPAERGIKLRALLHGKR